MKITQKATVALSQHQVRATGTYQRGTGNGLDAGATITCTCGHQMEFSFRDLPPDESDAVPYLSAIVATHQIAMMERA